jgi:uncharacterized protein (TIGR03435 family)
MNRTGRIVLAIAASAFAVIPLLSQTNPAKRLSFDVISIKPSVPLGGGAVRIGGGTRGDRYTMASANLRMLLQQGYGRTSNGPPAQLQISGGPSWIDSDRWDIQATADCSGGALSREQLQLMIQTMLEDRFQLKAHLETREMPIYNLVVAKEGKLKASEDQTPPNAGQAGPLPPCSPAPATPQAAAPPLPPPPPPGPPGQRGGPLDPNFVMPRGAMMMMFNPTGMALRASAVPISNLVNMLQNQVGRTIIDKTELKGLFDFTLQFSPEGLNGPPLPIPPGGGPAPAGPAGTTSSAADPVPSLFTAIQEIGLKLESAKGLVPLLVVDSVQKPTEN